MYYLVTVAVTSVKDASALSRFLEEQLELKSWISEGGHSDGHLSLLAEPEKEEE
jgi:hypothetical protein